MNGEVHDQLPTGQWDRRFEADRYVLTYNPQMGYVGQAREHPTTIPTPDEDVLGCRAVAVCGEKERMYAAVVVSPAAERLKARKARHQAAARLQAEQAKVKPEAAKAKALAEREERRTTTFLPAALRSPGWLRVPRHQDTLATLAGAYPFMAEGDLGVG